MRPISAGEGEERYTLYFPVHLKNKEALRFRDVLDTISDKLGVAVGAEDRGANLSVIRLASFGSMADARTAFQWLKAVFDLAAVENGVPISAYDSLDEFERCDLRFPGSWPRAAEAGWLPDTDGVRVDGIVSIVFPTIVPEHLRIVDQGAFAGEVTGRVEADAVLNAVRHASAASGDAKKIDLACASYIAALSHKNHQLRFLGFTTCLEVLADRKDKEEAFKAAIAYFYEAGEEKARSEGNAMMSRYSSRIRDFLEGGKQQSIPESIANLLAENMALIHGGLPADHPYKRRSAKWIASSIYDLRSKIAHQGTWGAFHNDKIHRAYQFAQSAARTLLRNALSAKEGDAR